MVTPLTEIDIAAYDIRIRGDISFFKTDIAPYLKSINGDIFGEINGKDYRART
jgi:hypothetical protein